MNKFIFIMNQKENDNIKIVMKREYLEFRVIVYDKLNNFDMIISNKKFNSQSGAYAHFRKMCRKHNI